jgi:hypothetical protein
MDAVKSELFPKMEASRVFMAISPNSEPDAKFCVELGAAIMYDKPIVVVVAQGREVAPGLRRIAHHIIDEVDLETPEGRSALADRLYPIFEEEGGHSADD